MGRYWDEEWPNLNSISIVIDGPWADFLSPEAFGILHRAVWFIASQTVYGWFSDPVEDPKLPPDVNTLCRLLRCSKSEWKRSATALEAFLDFSADGIRLKNSDMVRLTRTGGRAPLSAAVKSEANSRWDKRCAYCGSTSGPFHFDHLFPVARGGTDAASNIVLACGPCNLSKGSKTLEEWVCGRILKERIS